VFALEQWPDCLNPIIICTQDFQAYCFACEHVLPRAMELDAHDQYVASPLIVRAPTLANGLLTENPFTVTFEIDSGAVWDDGSPITSRDFAFTWQAILHTRGALHTGGYDLVDSIDTGRPRSAVIRLRSIDINWQELFGGLLGFVLEKAAFPNADPATPDLSGDMIGTIGFSGGPWKLQTWNLHEAVFVPNTQYWPRSRVPLLDRVTFSAMRPPAGAAGVDPVEYGAFRRGDVSAIFPAPVAVDLFHQLEGPNTRVVAGDGSNPEALWFNLQRPIMSDLHVRQALTYAIDRQPLVENAAALNNPGAKVLNCGLVSVPDHGPWCSRTYFDGFRYDVAHALRILRADGWDCSMAAHSPPTPCVKDGQPLVLTISYQSSNPRYTTALALVRQEAARAGFGFRLAKYASPGYLFSEVLPKGKFDIAIYSIGPVLDPSVAFLFACDQIPSQANPFGPNWSRWCDPQADRLIKESDRELDPAKRLILMQGVYELEVKDAVALPLYVLPNIAAWRTDRIAGPIGTYVSSAYGYGFFINMYDWHVP
jgi:peptide/nickel transport system substrate-binding protein